MPAGAEPFMTEHFPAANSSRKSVKDADDLTHAME
jgi:hypothetical protein